MHRRLVECFIVDILIATDKIKRNMKEIKTAEEFVADDTLFDATMRQLEIIGEAAKHVLKSDKYAKHAEKNWRKIVDFRNIVAHEYFGIDLDIVFEVAYERIPILEEEVLDLIFKVGVSEDLYLAVEDAKGVLSKMKRQESLIYLQDLEKQLRSK